MKKVLVMAALLLIAASGAYAEDLRVDLVCPASAKAGTGTAIATVTFTGQSPTPVTFSRFLRATIGNTTASTLGQLGIVGPIYLTKAATTVNLNQTSAAKQFYINTTNGMVNTAATFVLQVLDGNGKVIGTGTCSVPVVP